MSAAQPSHERPDGGRGPAPGAAASMASLHTRRHQARRRRQLARLDAGLAVAGALLVLLISPGLAIAGLIAGMVLVLCGISLVRERRRGGKAEASAQPVRKRRASSRR